MKSQLKLANASQLTDQLWIGGELARGNRPRATRQLNELTHAGIDSIIDCRIEWDDIDWVTEAKAQIDYLSIGVEDAGFLMPDEWWVEGTTYALEQISEGHIVLSHCQEGINRGPSMGFAILIAQEWDPVEALNLIRDRRPIARIAYAEQAMYWWMQSMGAPDEDALAQVRRIMRWRKDKGVARSTEDAETWMGNHVDFPA